MEKLFELKKRIEDNTVLNFFFSLSIDSDGEIIFTYHLTAGFHTVKQDKNIFNACDRETNVSGFNNILKDIEKNYINYKN